MKVNIFIQATPEEVFNFLAESVVEDIRINTGKKILKERLSANYCYEKSLANFTKDKIKVKVVIDEYEFPKLYSASVHSSRGINTMKYEFEPIDDGVRISYDEGFKSDALLKDWNHKVMSFIYSRRNKKRMLAQFKYIEQAINEKKN